MPPGSIASTKLGTQPIAQKRTINGFIQRHQPPVPVATDRARRVETGRIIQMQ